MVGQVKLEVKLSLCLKDQILCRNHFSLLRKNGEGTKYALDVEPLKIFDNKGVEFEDCCC